MSSMRFNFELKSHRTIAEGAGYNPVTVLPGKVVSGL